MRHWATRAAEWLRTSWLIIGISLLMLVFLECAYRAQGAVRRGITSSRATGVRPVKPRHPYADSAWYPVFLTERDSLIRWRWEPYSYSRMRPFAGRYVNIESTGIRFTPNERDGTSQAYRPRVFFLGGSTTWGFADRDSSTRPAVVARRLSALGFIIEAVNYGQLGYVGAQETHALLTELRRGNIPDAVVFWDGVNDINSAHHNGAPGLSYRESERAEDAEFNTMRRRRGGVVDDRLAIRSLMTKSQLFLRLLRAADRPVAVREPLVPRAFCRSVMTDWGNQVRLVMALAREYGFVPILIWQPQWQVDGSPRTAFEREVASRTLVASDEGLDEHRAECARLADSLALTMPGIVFNWARLHAGDSATVYVDQYSHTTERATAVEGDTLAKLLASKLIRPRR